MFTRNRNPIPVTGGLSDTILTDATSFQFLARDNGTEITYVTLGGAPYTPVPPISALSIAGGATSAKQDEQSAILETLATAARQDAQSVILDGLVSVVATATKQDLQLSALSSIFAEMSTAAKQDAQTSLLNAIGLGMATAAQQSTQQTTLANILAALATAAKQDAQTALLVSIDGKVATATKQDAQTALLTSVDAKVATAAKQDAIANLITTLNGIVATAAKQDIQSALLTLIEADLRAPLMDFRVGAALGKIANTRSLTILGNANNIGTGQVPMTLWDEETAYPFQATAVALEIVSSSANDSAAGTGARTVVVELIDNLYNEQILTFTMNGTTAVAIPGTFLAVNRVQVVTSGSTHSNVGKIVVRTVVGTITLAAIQAAQGLSHAFVFTVPAGKKLILDNFYIDNNGTGGLGSVIESLIYVCLRLQDGTIQIRQQNFSSSNCTPNNAQFNTPLTVLEKTTAFIQLQSVSTSGSNLSVSSGCILTPM